MYLDYKGQSVMSFFPEDIKMVGGDGTGVGVEVGLLLTFHLIHSRSYHFRSLTCVLHNEAFNEASAWRQLQMRKQNGLFY